MKDKLLASGLAAGRRLLGNSLTQAFSRDGLNRSRHLLGLLTLSDMRWLQIGNLIDIGALILVCALCLRHTLVRDPGGPWRSAFVAGLPVGPALDQPGSSVNVQRCFRSSNWRD
jgi:hypothetical protein